MVPLLTAVISRLTIPLTQNSQCTVGIRSGVPISKIGALVVYIRVFDQYLNV
jgi:hypothetical protein